jgi:hypothetical protein
VYRFTSLVRPGEHFAASDQASSWQRDLLAVACLIAVGVALKFWLLSHTEAMARDGIIYITFANRLQQGPITDVLRTTDQHPLYPVFILGVSKVVEWVRGEPDPLAWQLSAQLANCLASWLMLIPLYLLGKELGSWKIGFWSAMLYQCLPVVARFTADGVAEGTYLLFSSIALSGAVRGFRTQAWAWFGIAGLGAGLAYLARPEGVLLAPLVLVILLLAKQFGRWTISWRRLCLCGASLVLATVLVAAPYWVALGKLSNKPSVQKLFQTTQAQDPERPAAPTSPRLLLAERLTAESGHFYALWQVLDEISKSLLYGIWGMTALAILGFARELLRRPALGLMVLLMLVHVLLLWRLAVVRHYVSERHTVLLDFAAVCVAVYMWVHWETLWRAHVARVVAGGGRTILQYFPPPRYLLTVGILILCAWGAARTLRPLHANRIPLREAGLWLADRIGPDDQLIDPYGWPRFYANHDPSLGPGNAPPGRSPACFIVVDHEDDDPARITLLRHALAQRSENRQVFAYPSAEQPRVVVYQSPDRR